MTWTACAHSVLRKYEQRRRARGRVEVAWEDALAAEILFWRKNLRTWKRLDARLDPTRPLQPEVAAYLQGEPGAKLRIIDVGAGPLTRLGSSHDRYTLEITAVDVLGNEYGEVLDDLGIVPPVRTRACATEKLRESFEENYFDLAYASNTLDHGYDPLLAIKQMISCVKPGACVVLEHGDNEGVQQKYLGLHQWNFKVADDRLVIWRPGTRIDAASELTSVATLELAQNYNERDNRVVFRKLE